MALSLRSFLMFGANDAHVYEGPVKHKVDEVGAAESIFAEKDVQPVPVGAGSVAAFRAKCVGCLKCLPACPNGILKVSAKLRHLGRPALDFANGWCRPECSECAKACPAGAIGRNVVGALKKSQNTGIAVWNRDRCIAANGKDACRSCERHCPNKAIEMVDGLPKVDPSKCSGCGRCEHYCPARPKAAMCVEGR